MRTNTLLIEPETLDIMEMKELKMGILLDLNVVEREGYQPLPESTTIKLAQMKSGEIPLPDATTKVEGTVAYQIDGYLEALEASYLFELCEANGLTNWDEYQNILALQQFSK